MTKLRIQQISTNPETYFKKAFTEAHREGLRAVGLFWHREFLPLRFKLGAASRYGYARRSPRYFAEKQRRGLPPLVWSGRFSRTVMQAAKIDANSKGATVTMGPLPPYAYARLGRGGASRSGAERGALSRVPLAREIVKTTPSEVKRLVRVYDRTATEALRQNPAARKKTTKQLS